MLSGKKQVVGKGRTLLLILLSLDCFLTEKKTLTFKFSDTFCTFTRDVFLFLLSSSGFDQRVKIKTRLEEDDTKSNALVRGKSPLKPFIYLFSLSDQALCLSKLKTQVIYDDDESFQKKSFSFFSLRE